MAVLIPFSLSVAKENADPSAPLNAEYCFRSITMENGLSHTTVRQIVQDRRGFIWFGTHNGLNRFDGKSFRIYNSGNSNLQRNFISALMEDTSGRLWIGTDDGVYLYNPEADSINALKDVPEAGLFMDSQITGFQEDSHGNIWLSAEKYGLFRVSLSDGKVTRKISTAGKRNILGFCLDGDNLWFSSYSENLYVVDTTFRTAPIPFRDNLGVERFKGDVVHSISGDGRGFLYISSKRGLFRIDKSTLETEQLVSGFVRTHAFYSDTELWAGSESGGVTLNIVSCNVAELLEQQVKIFEPYASSYVTFTATHNDGVLEIATHNDGDKVPESMMEENMSNPDFNVQMLADALCMSRSSLARIMKSTFDCTVMTYIHNERMKKAASLLRTGKYLVNQVMYMTGYNTPSYFVKVFKNKYGVLPKDFIK